MDKNNDNLRINLSIIHLLTTKLIDFTFAMFTKSTKLIESKSFFLPDIEFHIQGGIQGVNWRKGLQRPSKVA